MIPTDSLDLSGDVSGDKSPLYPRVKDTIFFKKRQTKAGKPMVYAMVYVNLKQLRKSCKSSLSDALGFLIREFIRKGMTRSR